MNADTTQAISGVQTLIYGGLISLTTTVVLAVVQAFLAGRREVFLERRAIRERFFAYDLEKFKQFEQILLDYKSVAQVGIVPNEPFSRLTDFMVVASPSFVAQLRMLEVLGGMNPPTKKLIDAYRVVTQERPNFVEDYPDETRAVVMMVDERYRTAVVELQHAIIDVLSAYRVEILGGERTPAGLRGGGHG